MRVLVTGGAGYIGSHAVKALVEAGHEVLALDDLSRGHAQAVNANATFAQTSLHDVPAVTALLKERRTEAVLHFAAYAYVGESAQQPLRYYHNNVGGTIALLEAMEAAGVKRLVFSSTCATYGVPESSPINESAPQRPVSPYGWTKWMVERIIAEHAASRPGFAFATLRYFNVAGAALDGTLGEDHDPETHLIPLAILAALGRSPPLTVLGQDYPTPDGTCVRDYIHVEDLADAHIAVMHALRPNDRRVYNLGVGRGYSVNEVIAAVERVAGKPVPKLEGPRRQGDPPSLFADATLIRRELGWRPRVTSIDEIVASAYRWFEGHPQGYG